MQRTGQERKIDLSRIRIPPWAKPQELIWVELQEDVEGRDPVVQNYIEGEIESIDETNKTVKVRYTGQDIGPENVLANLIWERSEEPQILNDLVDLNILNQPEILKSLEMRFMEDEVFCFCGPSLIATNPYKQTPGLYTEEIQERLTQLALEGQEWPDTPHIWSICSRTFKQVFENVLKQTILLSGESGSGKTYLTQKCLEFFTSLSKKLGEGNQNPATNEVRIEDKILACNPILESFGHSKTVLNDNASRFAKYLTLFIDKDNKRIPGAHIDHYLLEKSRVTIQAPTERNFQIFYSILRFMPPDQLKKYRFSNKGEEADMTLFEYLYQSDCFTVPSIDDERLYQETVGSFDTLGFSQIEQEAIFKILAIILNLGNVPIDGSTYEEGAQPCKLTDNDYLRRVTESLEVEEEMLSEGCCLIIRKIGNFTATSPRTPHQCDAIRNALAKDLFNNTFNWIIKKINHTLRPEKTDKWTSVGLLDVFGFEDFQVNSIEQFCMNYMRERLTNIYAGYVFKAESIIFQEEGLSNFIGLIQYNDNFPILKLMDKKPAGIFHLIDSASKIAKDDGLDDLKLMNQIVKCHKQNPYFFYPRLKKDVFGISHTAKDVEYYVQGFVEKNRNELPRNLVDAVIGGNQEISKIFQGKLTHDEELEEKKKNPQNGFLGYHFRQQVQDLIDGILSSECNFVRCLKPNEAKRRDFWVPQLVINQIRYLGIVDSVNVRRDSLPVRKSFMNFYKKYQNLDQESPDRFLSFEQLRERQTNWKNLAQAVFRSIPEFSPGDALVGKSRIFMTDQFRRRLDQLLQEQ